jgi:hypothetical protein
MNTAALIDRCGSDSRAIARQNFPEIGQLSVRAVTLDQLANIQSVVEYRRGGRRGTRRRCGRAISRKAQRRTVS